MSPQITVEEAQKLGYMPVRQLPTGELAGIIKMLYTWGLFVGLDRTGYRTRFCYPTSFDATLALGLWGGEGDPPGPWIKEKGINKELGKAVSRDNPNVAI